MAGEAGQISFGTNIGAVAQEIVRGLSTIDASLARAGSGAKSPLDSVTEKMQADLARLNQMHRQALEEQKRLYEQHSREVRAGSSNAALPNSRPFSAVSKETFADLGRAAETVISGYTKAFQAQAPQIARVGQQQASAIMRSTEQFYAGLARNLDSINRGSGLGASKLIGGFDVGKSITAAEARLTTLQRALETVAKAPTTTVGESAAAKSARANATRADQDAARLQQQAAESRRQAAATNARTAQDEARAAQQRSRQEQQAAGDRQARLLEEGKRRIAEARAEQQARQASPAGPAAPSWRDRMAAANTPEKARAAAADPVQTAQQARAAQDLARSQAELAAANRAAAAEVRVQRVRAGSYVAHDGTGRHQVEVQRTDVGTWKTGGNQGVPVVYSDTHKQAVAEAREMVVRAQRAAQDAAGQGRESERLRAATDAAAASERAAAAQVAADAEAEHRASQAKVAATEAATRAQAQSAQAAAANTARSAAATPTTAPNTPVASAVERANAATAAAAAPAAPAPFVFPKLPSEPGGTKVSQADYDAYDRAYSDFHNSVRQAITDGRVSLDQARKAGYDQNYAALPPLPTAPPKPAPPAPRAVADYERDIAAVTGPAEAMRVKVRMDQDAELRKNDAEYQRLRAELLTAQRGRDGLTAPAPAKKADPTDDIMAALGLGGPSKTAAQQAAEAKAEADRQAAADADRERRRKEDAARDTALREKRAAESPEERTQRLNTLTKGVAHVPVDFLTKLADPGLVAYRRNTPTDQQQIASLREGIKAEGFRPESPITLGATQQGHLQVLEGYHRLLAAVDAGLKTVPTEVIARSQPTVFAGGTGQAKADPLIADRLAQLDRFPGAGSNLDPATVLGKDLIAPTASEVAAINARTAAETKAAAAANQAAEAQVTRIRKGLVDVTQGARGVEVAHTTDGYRVQGQGVPEHNPLRYQREAIERAKGFLADPSLRIGSTPRQLANAINDYQFRKGAFDSNTREFSALQAKDDRARGSVSREEAAAAQLTGNSPLMDAFKQSIGALRGEAGRAAPEVTTLANAIRSTSASAPELYRGMSGAYAENLLKQAQSGTVQLPFQGFTKDRELAQEFTTIGRPEQGPGRPLLLELERGAQALDFAKANPNGTFRSEQEFLTGGRFQVLGKPGIDEESGAAVLRLRQIPLAPLEDAVKARTATETAAAQANSTATAATTQAAVASTKSAAASTRAAAATDTAATQTTQATQATQKRAPLAITDGRSVDRYTEYGSDRHLELEQRAGQAAAIQERYAAIPGEVARRRQDDAQRERQQAVNAQAREQAKSVPADLRGAVAQYEATNRLDPSTRAVLEAAISSAPAIPGIGFRGVGGDYAAQLANLRPGQEVTLGPSSFTQDRRVAERFARERAMGEGSRERALIEVPRLRGLDVPNITGDRPFDREVLSQGRFRVAEVLENQKIGEGSGRIVRLEQLHADSLTAATTANTNAAAATAAATRAQQAQQAQSPATQTGGAGGGGKPPVVPPTPAAAPPPEDPRNPKNSAELAAAFGAHAQQQQQATRSEATASEQVQRGAQGLSDGLQTAASGARRLNITLEQAAALVDRGLAGRVGTAKDAPFHIPGSGDRFGRGEYHDIVRPAPVPDGKGGTHVQPPFLAPVTERVKEQQYERQLTSQQANRPQTAEERASKEAEARAIAQGKRIQSLGLAWDRAIKEDEQRTARHSQAVRNIAKAEAQAYREDENRTARKTKAINDVWRAERQAYDEDAARAARAQNAIRGVARAEAAAYHEAERRANALQTSGQRQARTQGQAIRENQTRDRIQEEQRLGSLLGNQLSRPHPTIAGRTEARQLFNSRDFELLNGEIVKMTANGARYNRTQVEGIASERRRQRANDEARTKPDNFLGGLLSGFTSRGFNGGGGGSIAGGILARGDEGKDARAQVGANIGGTAGTLLKYSALSATIGAVTALAADQVQQVLNYTDSLTDLGVAFGHTDRIATSYVNTLSEISRLSGSNVGEAIDAASRGARAFTPPVAERDENGNITGLVETPLAQYEENGAAVAGEAAKIALITNKALKDATGDLIAIGTAYDITAENLSQVTDAVAGAKRLGGDPANIAQGLANISVAGREAGFTINELADTVSLLIGQTDQSGTQVATRLSRLFAILGGQQGQGVLRSIGVDTTQSIRDQVEDLSAAYGGLGVAQQAQVRAALGGTAQQRELLPLLKDFGAVIANNFDATKRAGEGQEEFDRKSADLVGTLRKLQGDFKNIQIALFESDIFAPLVAGLYVVEPALHLVAQTLNIFNAALDSLGEATGLPVALMAGLAIDVAIATVLFRKYKAARTSALAPVPGAPAPAVPAGTTAAAARQAATGAAATTGAAAASGAAARAAAPVVRTPHPGSYLPLAPATGALTSRQLPIASVNGLTPHAAGGGVYTQQPLPPAPRPLPPVGPPLVTTVPRPSSDRYLNAAGNRTLLPQSVGPGAPVQPFATRGPSSPILPPVGPPIWTPPSTVPAGPLGPGAATGNLARTVPFGGPGLQSMLARQAVSAQTAAAATSAAQATAAAAVARGAVRNFLTGPAGIFTRSDPQAAAASTVPRTTANWLNGPSSPVGRLNGRPLRVEPWSGPPLFRPDALGRMPSGPSSILPSTTVGPPIFPMRAGQAMPYNPAIRPVQTAAQAGFMPIPAGMTPRPGQFPVPLQGPPGTAMPIAPVGGFFGGRNGFGTRVAPPSGLLGGALSAIPANASPEYRQQLQALRQNYVNELKTRNLGTLSMREAAIRATGNIAVAGTGLSGAIGRVATTIGGGLAGIRNFFSSGMGLLIGAVAGALVVNGLARGASENYKQTGKALDLVESTSTGTASASEIRQKAADLRTQADTTRQSGAGFFGSTVDFLYGDQAKRAAGAADKVAERYDALATRIDEIRKENAADTQKDPAAAIDVASPEGVANGLKLLSEAGRDAETQFDALIEAFDRMGKGAVDTSVRMKQADLQIFQASLGTDIANNIAGTAAGLPDDSQLVDFMNGVSNVLIDPFVSGEVDRYGANTNDRRTLEGIDTNKIGEDIRLDAEKSGADPTTDEGKAALEKLIRFRLEQALPNFEDPGLKQRIIDEQVAQIGRTAKPLTDPGDLTASLLQLQTEGPAAAAAKAQKRANVTRLGQGTDLENAAGAELTQARVNLEGLETLKRTAIEAANREAIQTGDESKRLDEGDLQYYDNLIREGQIAVEGATLSHLETLGKIAAANLSPFDEAGAIQNALETINTKIAANEDPEIERQLEAERTTTLKNKAQQQVRAQASAGLSLVDVRDQVGLAEQGETNARNNYDSIVASLKEAGVAPEDYDTSDAYNQAVIDVNNSTRNALIARRDEAAALAKALIDPRDQFALLGAEIAAQQAILDGAIAGSAEAEAAALAIATGKREQVQYDRQTSDAALAAGTASSDLLGQNDDAIREAETTLAGTLQFDARGKVTKEYIEAQKALDDLRVKDANDSRAAEQARLGSLVQPGDDVAAAARALEQAQSELIGLTAGNADYWDKQKEIAGLQIALADQQRIRAQQARLEGIDRTDSVKVAADELKAAREDLAASANKGPDEQRRARMNVKDKENNLEQEEFQRRLSDAQTGENLGRISHSAYIKYLRSESDRLGAIRNRTRQQQEQLDQIDGLLKEARNSTSGQFNIGDVKVPTLYQVRRYIAESAEGVRRALGQAEDDTVSNFVRPASRPVLSTIIEAPEALPEAIEGIQTQAAVQQLNALQAAINGVAGGPVRRDRNQRPDGSRTKVDYSQNTLQLLSAKQDLARAQLDAQVKGTAGYYRAQAQLQGAQQALQNARSGGSGQTVQISINGGDLSQVKQVLAAYLGPQAFSTTTFSTAKI